MHAGGPGRPAPMSSAQLEQQFQARIAQAKEAARLASIAAAARAQGASNGPPSTSMPAVPGVPFRPPQIPGPPTTVPEPFAMKNIPPDVKNRINRLVEFVARNGDAFEATAKERERDNPDFSFLRPGGPYSDYYQWKKQQLCGSQQSPMGIARTPSPRPQFIAPNGPSPVSKDLLGDMSVGAMANVCKFARASGVQPYAPIPQKVIMNVGSLPPVEQARLEIRLSEFYRDEEQ
ncbi:Calcium homeostasis endoplasmic reticulum protein [Phytophthora citrophthora]|uniref:Calcium homeostasis endoplasmic reticulum protein n=1 Tax=Phytophthora citrophthora TaxID=4793 RepID=A0AAD9LCN3_9STRA|nr:Calcium homeostasis endoplasmic reticulum protein [Phytophthora citrophthora]